MTSEPEAGARYRQAIGRTIAALRARQGVSLRAMSESAGVSVAYLSEIENGRNEPSAAMLGQLATAFHLTLPELLRAIAERFETDDDAPAVSLEGLDRDEVDDVARYADWLRWRKDHH